MTGKRLLDSPHHRSARIVLLALAAGAILAIAIPSVGFAQSTGKITRTIDLEAIPNSPFIIQGGDGEFAGMGAPPPSAMVSLHSFGGDALVEFKFKAMPIIQQLENGAYSLYFTTRASAAEYVSGEPGSGRIKFNTDFNGTVNLWGMQR